MKTIKIIITTVILLSIATITNAQVKVVTGGNVGINSTTPLSSFQIYDSFAKIAFGSAATSGLGWGTGYMGFNAVRQSAGNWLSLNDGSTSNGGSIIYGSLDGTINFVPINSTGNSQQTNNDAAISNKIAIKVSSTGTMINSVGDYSRTLWINALTSNACGYHMKYGGNDNFYVHASGWIYSQGQYLGSDESFKKDITTIPSALEKVLLLRGVTYKLNYSGSNSVFNDEVLKMGVIAQEVESIVPEVVKTMPNGTKAVAYQNLIGLLIEAIKEQQVQIDSLKNDMANCCGIKTESTTKRELGSNAENLNSINENKASLGVILYQNTPNPFTENTTIKCYVPQNITSTKLCIYNMQGVQVKCVNISERGNVSIVVQSNELGAGIYPYVLITDGAASDTKQMILTK